MISNRIMKTDEFDDAIFYKAECSCGGHTHSLELSFDEKDKWDNDISLVFYVPVEPQSSFDNSYYYKKESKKFYEHWYWSIKLNWWEPLINRIKYAYLILIRGWFEWETSFVFGNEKQISSYIDALIEGRDKLLAKKGKINVRPS